LKKSTVGEFQGRGAKHMLIGHWIERWAQARPQKTAIYFEDRRYTYAQFFERIDRAAGYMISKGVKKGDRVAILSYNCPEYLELYFALARIGGIMVPLNYRLAPRETEFILRDSGTSTLIFHEDFADAVLSVSADLQFNPISIGEKSLSWARDYESCIEAGTRGISSSSDISPEDPHILMYTSGSTGQPKGAMLSYRKTFFNTLNADIYYGLTSGDSMVVTRPMFHSGGLLVQATPILFKGGAAIVQPRARASGILDAIQTYRVTALEAAATVYSMMLNETDLSRYDLSSLRVCYTGGERVQTGLLKEFHKRGLALSQIFGQTETSTITYLDPLDAVSRVGSVGKAVFFGDLKIVDPEGEDVKAGDTGEIVVSGPILMSGYWGRADLTAQTIKDNWLYTGDLGQRDEDGFIYIVDRSKNMFISGGENVYPAEVEKVLLENDRIEDAAVHSVGDPKWGEVGRAVLVLRRDVHMTEEEVISFCEDKIAKYKIPKYVAFVKKLPKTAAGKIMRHKLAAL
jgi:fatty-acyl-CoA synthase